MVDKDHGSVVRIMRRPASSQNGPRLREWIEWFDFLEKEMIELCLVRSVYAEIRHMIERNPDLHRPSVFYSWMRALYFTRTVISITRLLEDDNKTKSFVRLLRRIEQQPEVLSRRQFIAAYLSSEGMSSIPRREVERIANRDFDGVSGAGTATLQRRDVTKDINDLLGCASVVTRHRNERVAHLGINPSDQFAGLEDLDRAIEKLGDLFNKYSMLLRRHTCDLFPTIQYDWTAIFRVPWERKRP